MSLRSVRDTFVERYYAAFALSPNDLPDFYAPNAILFHTPFRPVTGADNVQKFLRNRYGNLTLNVKLTYTDAHIFLNKDINVCVMGRFTILSLNAVFFFTQVFILSAVAKNTPSAYYICNDIMNIKLTRMGNYDEMAISKVNFFFDNGSYNPSNATTLPLTGDLEEFIDTAVAECSYVYDDIIQQHENNKIMDANNVCNMECTTECHIQYPDGNDNQYVPYNQEYVYNEEIVNDQAVISVVNDREQYDGEQQEYSIAHQDCGCTYENSEEYQSQESIAVDDFANNENDVDFNRQMDVETGAGENNRKVIEIYLQEPQQSGLNTHFETRDQAVQVDANELCASQMGIQVDSIDCNEQPIAGSSDKQTPIMIPVMFACNMKELLVRNKKVKVKKTRKQQPTEVAPFDFLQPSFIDMEDVEMMEKTNTPTLFNNKHSAIIRNEENNGQQSVSIENTIENEEAPAPPVTSKTDGPAAVLNHQKTVIIDKEQQATCSGTENDINHMSGSMEFSGSQDTAESKKNIQVSHGNQGHKEYIDSADVNVQSDFVQNHNNICNIEVPATMTYAELLSGGGGGGGGGDEISLQNESQPPNKRAAGSKHKRGKHSSGRPDKRRIFVGMIPKHVTRSAIEKLFLQFGPLSDLRVYKSNREVNYAFIKFRTGASRRMCIAARPIAIQSGGQQFMLNVRCCADDYPTNIDGDDINDVNGANYVSDDGDHIDGNADGDAHGDGNGYMQGEQIVESVPSAVKAKQQIVESIELNADAQTNAKTETKTEANSNANTNPDSYANKLASKCVEPVAVKTPALDRGKQENEKTNRKGIVFIGLVPKGVRECHLRDLFKKYGQITEILLCNNSKSANAQRESGQKYAFVTFESWKSVEKCLEERPISIKFKNELFELNVCLSNNELRRCAAFGSGCQQQQQQQQQAEEEEAMQQKPQQQRLRQHAQQAEQNNWPLLEQKDKRSRNGKRAPANLVATAGPQRQPCPNPKPNPNQNATRNSTPNSSPTASPKSNSNSNSNSSSNYRADRMQRKLFFGQVPSGATYEEIWELFRQYGDVTELRLLDTKGGNGYNSNNDAHKCGFVTFKNAESADYCSRNPIYGVFNYERVRLNILRSDQTEEKRSRQRS